MSTDPGTDRLPSLLHSLATTIGENPSRDLLRDIEFEVGRQHRKNAQHHLVSHLAEAAAKTEKPFESFLKGLDGVDATINPDTAIRGLLLNTERTAHLVPQLIAGAMVPDLTAGKTGFVARSLVFTPALFKDLRKSLNEVFSDLGIQVWEKADPRIRTPEWCDAWARFSHDLLLCLPRKDPATLQSLSNRYTIILADADAKSAASLLRFLLFLNSQICVPEEHVLQSIRRSPIGSALREQATCLLGEQTQREPAEPGLRLDAGKVLASPVSKSIVPDALPDPLKTVVGRFCAEIGAFVTKQAADRQEFEDLRAKFKKSEAARFEAESESQALSDQLANLQARISANEAERLRLDERLRAVESELAKRSEELTAAVSGRQSSERALQQLRDDYENLDRRSEREIEESRQQLLRDLDIHLRDHWDMTARMLELVIRKERDVEHLKTMWSQLDHILWDTIGQRGREIKKTDD